MARGRSVSRSASSGRFVSRVAATTVAVSDNNRTGGRKHTQYPHGEPQRLNRPVRQGSQGPAASRVNDHPRSLSYIGAGSSSTTSTRR